MNTQNKISFFVLVIALGFTSACSNKESTELKTPIVRNVLAVKSGTDALLSTGHQINLYTIKNSEMFLVDGTLTDPAFQALQESTSKLSPSARKQAVSENLSAILAKITELKGIPLYRNDEAGYFTALLPFHENLFASVKGVSFPSRIILNPVIYDKDAVAAIRALKPTAEELPPRGTSASSTAGFSGLERMGAPEFVKQAEASIGSDVKVNGSDVTVGITDTGITYNHPTFRSADGHNRISYMKDFTGEGTIFFPKTARFEATPGGAADEMIVTAEVVVTPRLPARPMGDKLTPIDGLKIKVSQELRDRLMTAGASARFGYLAEDSLQTADEEVDVNNNGKLDDKLYLVLVPGLTADDDVVYFDSSGTGDFRKSPALGDWNRTKSMVSVFAEKVGFTIERSELPTSADDKVTVAAHRVSLVGFDPGNHGSHVAGIAAGYKTIANDDAMTLARGVAPEARIALNRVCANNGGCNATEAMVDLAMNAGAEVINMSLGGLGPFNDGYGVQETVINRLTILKNVLFVISAGNSGPGRQTVGSPSVARLSLSVGATASRDMIQRQYEWPGAGTSESTGKEEDDFMLFFSSRGPTAAGGFKPNISAPGTELSSVQLNSPPGARGGLDIYWGTSMAAPSAAGAYALLLDGIKKYNAKNPGKELGTNAVFLRQVLIETARPFDANRFDPATGTKTTGQYTWVDQGTGMLNLPAAWRKLMEARDNALPTAVNLSGKPVELDYQILLNSTGPNGIAYDGSRPSPEGVPPAFGTGLYLDYFGNETLRQVNIARRLPETLAGNPEAGNLTVQLKTTLDEFELRTVFFGSDKKWLKAGVRDQLPCMISEESRLSVIGRGVEVAVDQDGKATLNPMIASVLNVCLDRQMIASELSAGDHGALIYGYRAIGDKVSSVPSFIVPVYITVPHKILANSKSYDLELNVRSFGVSRNYVQVPAGTSVVTVTMEVSEPKLDERKQLVPSSCAGVELMSLEGINTSKPFKTRVEARVANCGPDGAPNVKKRILTFSRSKPAPGIWDLHIFGSYKFANSGFKLRVDYVTGKPSVDKIEGPLAALNGSFTWNLVEASTSVSPDSSKSTIEISTLEASTASEVVQDGSTFVESPLGKLRVYPAGTKSVTLSTGESPGNDLDIVAVECPMTVTDPNPIDCGAAGASAGPTDEETVTFVPKPNRAYALLVQGYAIKTSGAFVSVEKIAMTAERGSVQVSGLSPAYVIEHKFSADQLASSKLVNHPLFIDGKYKVTGSLTLKTSQGVVLDALAVRISQAK